MDSHFKEDIEWNPVDEDLPDSPPPSTEDRRHSSSASSSTICGSDSSDGSGGRGRRARPSVASASSQLPTVQEKREQRLLSLEKPSLLLNPSSEETVVSSQKVLTSFNKVATRNVEKEEARRQQLERYNQENDGQRVVYKRLKSWADTDVMFVILALAERNTEWSDLGQLEEYWQMKPDWVDVRWIHAPLGLGLTHSSVEDIFLHDGPRGREFENAGRSGWPYLETEILNFRHRENFQEMRDVYLLLNKKKEMHEDLNESTWKADRNASLHSDIDWRADHLAMEPTFWNLVDSDMPWQLTEGLAMGAQGPRDGLQPIARHVDKQVLSSHPFYKDAQLVRNPFRTFHRSDGFLLTLSPMAGVNYLDKNFQRHIREPLDAIFDNDDASAVGHVFQAFADQGTNTWHRRTVEWFLIYLLTEIGMTPHSLRQGCNAPTFESAYSVVIQDLKRRRHQKWKPKMTVELVRDYLNCIDEVTTVSLLLKKQVDLFKILQLDVKKFETEDARSGRSADHSEGETSPQRLKFAMNHVNKQNEYFERLLIDLKQSMDALFQLRSIEQNERAIVSDSQNKAIMVFTVVTVIFLPLSFFTSYYGMNLGDIVNSAKTQGYFWKVCGTATLAIVLFTALSAFRHQLRRALRNKMGKRPRAMM